MSETAVNDDHHSARLIQKVFGHRDLYSILQVDRQASAAVIKKAYIRAALKHHPDKGGEKETFQALCLVHRILSDEERRKVYDEEGLVDDCFEDDEYGSSGGGGGEGNNEKSFAYWYEYFRKLTPAVTMESIDNLQMSYVGSEEERVDIMTAYKTQNGDLFKIMDYVLFAEKGTERHIIEIIDKLIEEGLIQSVKKYRVTKAKALEAVDKTERKKKKKDAKGKGVEEEEEEEEQAQDLALLIRNRQKSRAATLGSILAKYGGDAGMEEEDDQEVEEERATATSRSSKRRRPNPKK